MPNPNIQWEQVAQTNLGFDMGFFNNRLNLSLDLYNKKTSEMLVKAASPITSGYQDVFTTYINAGSVRNRGIDLFIHSINTQGAVRWETTLTGSYNRNKILDLNSDTPLYGNEISGRAGDLATIQRVGWPINSLYGYVMQGIFQTDEEISVAAIQQPGTAPGDVRFRDINGDGVINQQDRTYLGSPTPSWLFSLDNTLSYKGFDLTLFLQGVAGNKLLNANNIQLMGMSSAVNQLSKATQRWTAPDTSNTVPRAVYGDPNDNNRISDRFIENGSFLRIKNVTLAYNFPDRWLKALRLNGARIFVACDNIYTFTKYTGIDPEIALSGIDQGIYPYARSFTFGLNINF
jgi:hypothetical protein